MLRSADVDRGRTLRIGLGAVDVGPRSGMENEVDLAERRRRKRDVPVLVREPGRTREGLEQRRAELPARPCYEDASRAERIGDDVLQR